MSGNEGIKQTSAWEAADVQNSVDMKTSSALYKSGLDKNVTKQAVDKKPQEVVFAVKSCRGIE